MEYIERHISGTVSSSFETFKCVVVTGARQTGKSTLIRHMFPDMRYVPIDDPLIEEQATLNPRTFMMLNPAPAIYDEVQRAKELFRHIKLVCDATDDRGLFCLSGSQPLGLMEGASESLAGRAAIMELSGLSLREIQRDSFLEAFLPTWDYVVERARTATKPDNIWQVIHRGGYPQLQDSRVDWYTFYSSYVKTYLERDVRELTAVQDINDFRRFMVAMAARTGQLLNYANVASEIGRDQTTIKGWVSILETTGIIYILRPYHPTELKRATKTPKIYFRDTGLASYLTRWLTPETLAVGAAAGNMFETWVVGEILKSYSNRGIDYHYALNFYRGRDLKSRNEDEIDLIIEQDGTLYPIEIKLAERVKAEQTSAFQVIDKVADKKRGMGAVICMCPTPDRLRDNVLTVPAWYL